MKQSITETLAAFLAGIEAKDLPPETTGKLRDCLIDYLGAVWFAANDPLGAQYRELAAAMSPGTYPVIGGGSCTEPFAAFANAALGHVREVDDLQRGSTMHVGITVFPVLFALAEAEGFDSNRWTAAAASGYEAGIRIGQTFGREHYARFHTTGTAGTFAAAAAAARYLGLSAEATADALGHAGTQAAGLWQFLSDGALGTKPLHPGKAALNGLLAARLAQKGIAGARHIIEGEKGMAGYAAPHADLSAITRDMGKPYMVDSMCFKNYPCCGQTHSMLDALRMLMEENKLTGKDIVKVEARVYQQALDLTSNPDPKSLGEARFSLPFCMGVVLKKGSLGFNDINEDILKDEAVRRESRKVQMVFDAEVDKLFPKARPCRIIITTTNGQNFGKTNLYRRGDPELPMRLEDVEAKFRSVTEGILSGSAQEAILTWAESLEEQTDIPKVLYSGHIGA